MIPSLQPKQIHPTKQNQTMRLLHSFIHLYKIKSESLIWKVSIQGIVQVCTYCIAMHEFCFLGYTTSGLIISGHKTLTKGVKELSCF